MGETAGIAQNMFSGVPLTGADKIGAYASLAQMGLSAGGKMYGGRMQEQSDRYASGVLGQEAGASVASGIQGAIADKRYTNYVASSAAARAAGTGTTGTSPSVLNVIGNIQSQGEYKALTSLYTGQDRANELLSRAQGITREGRAAQTAGWLSGMSNVLTGGMNWYTKYGAGGVPGSVIQGTGMLNAGAEMA
jgi:hypothetical protein